MIYNKNTNMWTPMKEEKGLYTYEMYIKRRKPKPEKGDVGSSDLGNEEFRKPNKKGKIQWNKTVQVVEPNEEGETDPRDPWSTVF